MNKDTIDRLNERANWLRKNNPSIGSENWARLEEINDILKFFDVDENLDLSMGENSFVDRIITNYGFTQIKEFVARFTEDNYNHVDIASLDFSLRDTYEKTPIKTILKFESELKKLLPIYPSFPVLQPENTVNTRKDGLTEQEGRIMDNLISAWNEFLKLDIQHPSEINDFGNGIHQCQYQLCMRILRREYPLGYPMKK